MQDEEMDNMDQKIKEACESYHPAYNDKAWDKMELLLDKHLPQKRVRKKPLVFFLFLFLITAAVFIERLNPGEKTYEVKLVRIPPKTLPAIIQPGKDDVPALTSTTSRDLNELLQVKGENSTSKRFEKTAASKQITNNSHHNLHSSGEAIDFLYSDKATIQGHRELQDGETDPVKDDAIAEHLSATKESTDQITNTIATVLKKDSVFISPVLAEANLASKASPGNKKASKGFANSFAVTISAGPDLSFVRLETPGKTRLNYGAGLSYTFANRITVRSGFYTAKKLYTAKPGDYHPPSSYWTNNIDLQKVDADCRVYEIPLSATYTFKPSKNHQWLASMGLSTYLMKSETYHYFYKNPQGQSMYRAWTATEKNNHYFSVLTISGGYQYRVNNHLSIMAEPYYKLPLNGVGFGKIKLNSSGVLITASIKPFGKK